MDPADVAATFCATLADEWWRDGLTDVVVAPGSRSTPLVLALADTAGLGVHVHHDERAAGFMALGLGLASGRPAVVATTSGTAAAELHPAVVEAHQARVPVIVATADRPAELRDVGAPQAIAQTHLYGSAVRWFHDPGVPDDAARASWRSLAARAWAEATGPVPGPVHLNLPFREPLVGTPGPLPEGRPNGAAWHRHRPGGRRGDRTLIDEVAGHLRDRRGVIVVGRGGGEQGAVGALAGALGWPVLAGCRSGGWSGRSVAASDSLLRHPRFAAEHRAEVAVVLGEPPASRVVNGWVDEADVQVRVVPEGTWIDPGRRAGIVTVVDPTELCAALVDRFAGPVDEGWSAAWAAAEAAAQEAFDAVLAGHAEVTEPGVARALLAAVPDGTTVVASSSMPVRDLEWYGRPRAGVDVLANRGANGIDGVTSTAAGVALTGGPTVAHLGDIAFLHDTNGLLGLAGRPLDLTLVVVDNDGGGIFSFLAQRQELGPARFEQLFGTPHGVDLGALAAAHGLAVTRPETATEVGPAVAEAIGAGGVRAVIVGTNRDANVAVHRELHDAVAAALSG